MIQLLSKKILHSMLMLIVIAGMAGGATAPKKSYEPTWNSLKNYRTPQWLRDGKFGIYTHWGVYSVPAQGPNGTWFANRAYANDQGPQRKYWEATYGPLEKFGYKDLIPMFTGEKFNADEWADLFQKAGAALPDQWRSITTGSPCGTPSTLSGTLLKWVLSGMWWANLPKLSKNAT